MDFFEVTGGRVLSFRNVQPGSLGTEKKPIVFRSRGVIQRSRSDRWSPARRELKKRRPSQGNMSYAKLSKNLFNQPAPWPLNHSKTLDT